VIRPRRGRGDDAKDVNRPVLDQPFDLHVRGSVLSQQGAHIVLIDVGWDTNAVQFVYGVSYFPDALGAKDAKDLTELAFSNINTAQQRGDLENGKFILVIENAQDVDAISRDLNPRKEKKLGMVLGILSPLFIDFLDQFVPGTAAEVCVIDVAGRIMVGEGGDGDPFGHELIEDLTGDLKCPFVTLLNILLRTLLRKFVLLIG